MALPHIKLSLTWVKNRLSRSFFNPGTWTIRRSIGLKRFNSCSPWWFLLLLSFLLPLHLSCNPGDGDGDGYDACRDGETECDCDDTDSDVYPGAQEQCNGEDSNCDGTSWQSLEGLYLDRDGDGQGAPGSEPIPCEYVLWSAPNGDDCDDSNSTVGADFPELCDGLDNDCDGEVDEGFIEGYYLDLDGDGTGAADQPLQDCGMADWGVQDDSDCNDGDPLVGGGLEELCDGLDNDCDGLVDEDFERTFYYPDLDGDGMGDALSAPMEACSAPPGYVSSAIDCDDSDSSIFPGSEEACNAVDDDCDGDVDEGVLVTFYLDEDADGYGVENAVVEACEDPGGYALNLGDCAPEDGEINPGAQEVCDGRDNNCDGNTDDVDVDQDGFDCATDCEDNDPLIYPGASEIDCDGLDNDCDLRTDEASDIDGDGYTTCANLEPGTEDCNDSASTVYPGADEVDDGFDNDCDGEIDEGN